MKNMEEENNSSSANSEARENTLATQYSLPSKVGRRTGMTDILMVIAKEMNRSSYTELENQ
jgi:hypothetical protein